MLVYARINQKVGSSEADLLYTNSMSTTAVGREAESRVVDHLIRQGFRLIGQNWRTRWCEIDIVMQKKQTVYFIEVKHRTSDRWGDGLDYITPHKLRQMRFAAELWLAEHDWDGDAQLAAVGVSPTLVGQLVELE